MSTSDQCSHPEFGNAWDSKLNIHVFCRLCGQGIEVRRPTEAELSRHYKIVYGWLKNHPYPASTLPQD